MPNIDLSNALKVLNTQGVISYPTEAVFGLGCDPDSPIAIEKVLQLKKRPASKGLILIAANIEQLQNYADFSLLNNEQRDVYQRVPIYLVSPPVQPVNRLN